MIRSVLEDSKIDRGCAKYGAREQVNVDHEENLANTKSSATFYRACDSAWCKKLSGTRTKREKLCDAAKGLVKRVRRRRRLEDDD
jgi:hypothetical protein